MGDYFRPGTLDDALAALQAGPRTVLAGGTDLYPASVGRPIDDDILDISGLPDAREITIADDRWRVPMLATWTDLVRHDLPARFDGLKTAARAIGGVQIQNRGTVVGNVCHASPAADGLPNLIALGAAVELASVAGRRSVPISEFVVGNRRTVRRADELVTALVIPDAARDGRSAFLKLGSRAYLVISIAMVAAVVDLDDAGRVASARIAVGACSEVAQRLPDAEARLVGHAPSSAIARTIVAADLAVLSPIDDVRGPAAYRRDAALTLVRRAVEALAA